MKKFQYKVENFSNGNATVKEIETQNKLNEFGNDGWENYAIIPSTQVNGSNTYFFKREIQPKVFEVDTNINNK